MSKSVCVVGAGLSGLAAIRELRLGGHEVTCLEAGTAIGGSWRYGNDNGVSATYASLHTNVSRRNMQFPSLRFAGAMEERPHHSQLLGYLERYAEVNDLFGSISLGARVRRAWPDDRGEWLVEVDGHPTRRFDALVVATGQFWDPQIPTLAGEFAGETLHVRDYRTPEPFVGRRVLVLGAGQSALDIAAEISFVAQRTLLSCRRGHHLLPARILGRSLDRLDIATLNRLPWPVFRRGFQALLRITGAKPYHGDLPVPDFPMLEHRWPALVTPNIERALAEKTFAVRPNVTRLEGEHAIFSDGTREAVDAIVFATGYRVTFPFLPDPLGRGDGQQFPLYRRILSPHAENLAFIGILDAGVGRLEVVERQAQWLTAVLGGRLRLPSRPQMWLSIHAGNEPRSHRRFGDAGAYTTLCDRHAYLRVLDRDLRSVPSTTARQ
ncbi:MAG TPA: NAD(P)-binding domain-containing protein [Solirubrobacteraceae bacterium]|nr:NAD(P)-binding domain-containing protein [Solirubrobacteraceae bacterium]